MTDQISQDKSIFSSWPPKRTKDLGGPRTPWTEHGSTWAKDSLTDPVPGRTVDPNLGRAMHLHGPKDSRLSRDLTDQGILEVPWTDQKSPD